MIKKHQKFLYSASSFEKTILAFRLKLLDIFKKEAENLKCPISHIDTLIYIAEKGNPSMKEIATHLKITPPSATAIIETMQKKKLVTRVLNEKDRRTIRVILTSKAWGLFKSFHKHKLTVFTKMLSKLEVDEQEQFIRTLNKLIKE